MADRELTMAAAISEAIAQEMENDEKVFVLGEDVAKYGGIFGATGGSVSYTHLTLPTNREV